MTVVVGLVRDNKVYMGSDSCCTMNDLEKTLVHPKVIKLNDQMLVGYAGTLRGAQLMEYTDWLPKYDSSSGMDLRNYICVDFIDGLMSLLRENHYVENNLGVEAHNDIFLVGIQGRLFCIDCEFQVVETTAPYCCIGSGASYAYGSLYAHWNYELEQNPETIVHNALEASGCFCQGVKGPYYVMKI
jgi:ATP-dependent protease HslVU (ClpYQ) peptidase subunit